MRLRNLYLSPLIMILASCATQSGLWVKSDVTPLQFHHDYYTCLQESQQPYGFNQGGFGWGPGWGGYNGYSGVQTNPELYSACMKARGYSWQPDRVPGQ